MLLRHFSSARQVALALAMGVSSACVLPGAHTNQPLSQRSGEPSLVKGSDVTDPNPVVVIRPQPGTPLSVMPLTFEWTVDDAAAGEYSLIADAHTPATTWELLQDGFPFNKLIGEWNSSASATISLKFENERCLVEIGGKKASLPTKPINSNRPRVGADVQHRHFGESAYAELRFWHEHRTVKLLLRQARS